ncbi:MAG TPA: acetyl-CoA C-acyltransferase [Bacillota bacterium]|jgi:acetyl-CoA acyltransferase|nr:acetyl-CoA C-acyltransferase [Bacillota bacterium]NLA47142.1 acetyl-CoA C-acyltransferase [Bacillota bacterium]HOA35955.1 acetyl-CoA C-acyltransferase [Bacillota bacterium]HOJ83367.1 acetyl-CoA C-acyltransferase [Bacillota bacterium]HOL15186.1 acetyl-CoA C-acyltransferase [Bacillota bacterium]
MKEAVIVSSVRTAVGRAPRGTLRFIRPDYLASEVIKEAVARAKGLDPAEIEDVILGCSFPEAEQGMNVGRLAALQAGLPDTVPGQTVNRFCSSGLQAIALAAERIMCGFADVIVAGGVESMSMVPMGGNKVSPSPVLVESLIEAYTPMGITAENVAERFNISREDQDKLALRSHQNAAAAIKEGRFKEEIVPVKVIDRYPGPDNKIVEKEFVFDTDEGVRYDTSLEVLAKLRPAFKKDGSVTAGNSSQTSDGAAAAVVMSAEKASALGLKPMAVFRGFAVAGCPPDIMGVGPAVAIPRLMKLTGKKIEDIDLFELNEAFASQALYCIRELGLDLEKVNVNGGAIALGHPLGCTGAKLTATLLHELKRRGGRFGVVSMCIGGGMGAAGLFEMV